MSNTAEGNVPLTLARSELPPCPSPPGSPESGGGPGPGRAGRKPEDVRMRIRALRALQGKAQSAIEGEQTPHLQIVSDIVHDRIDGHFEIVQLPEQLEGFAPHEFELLLFN